MGEKVSGLNASEDSCPAHFTGKQSKHSRAPAVPGVELLVAPTADISPQPALGIVGVCVYYIYLHIYIYI